MKHSREGGEFVVSTGPSSCTARRGLENCDAVNGVIKGFDMSSGASQDDEGGFD